MNVHQGTSVDDPVMADSLLADGMGDATVAPDPDLSFADLRALDAANRPITPDMILIARRNMERAQADNLDAVEPASWDRRLIALFRAGI